MSFEDIKTGCVLRYPYLWHREHAEGETAGRKSRPVAVAARLERAGEPDALLLFPLTTSKPSTGRHAIEIPETEKRRAGLDRNVSVWIILDEYNYDLVGESFYLEPIPPLGQFSKAFFGPVLRMVLQRLPASRRVRRTD